METILKNIAVPAGVGRSIEDLSKLTAAGTLDIDSIQLPLTPSAEHQLLDVVDHVHHSSA